MTGMVYGLEMISIHWETLMCNMLNGPETRTRWLTGEECKANLQRMLASWHHQLRAWRGETSKAAVCLQRVPRCASMSGTAWMAAARHHRAGEKDLLGQTPALARAIYSDGHMDSDSRCERRQRTLITRALLQNFEHRDS